MAAWQRTKFGAMNSAKILEFCLFKKIKDFYYVKKSF